MSPPSATAPSARSHTPVAVIMYLAAMVAAGAAAYLLTLHLRESNAQLSATADDDVQRARKLGKPVVAEFGANSCENCREMKLVLGALAREHGERVTVVNIDLVKYGGYASRYNIQLIPTQMFFDAQGREIGRHTGKISGKEILARLGVSAGASAP